MYPILILAQLTVLAGGAFGQTEKTSIELFNQKPPNDSFGVMLKRSYPTLPEDYLEGTNYICKSQGVWILYEETQNYAANGWINAYNPGCYEGSVVPVSSAWFVESSQNESIPSINLFGGEWWTDPTRLVTYTQDAPVYSGNFNSVIVTGSPSVTFYTEVNYGGRGICLQRIAGFLATFASDLDYLGVTVGQIKSFRFGCFGTEIANSTTRSVNVSKSKMDL